MNGVFEDAANAVWAAENRVRVLEELLQVAKRRLLRIVQEAEAATGFPRAEW